MEAGARWLHLHQRLSRWLARGPFGFEAEDLASEVVFRAWSRVDIVHESWPRVWAWAKKVACHMVVDRLRLARRQPQQFPADVDGFPGGAASGEGNATASAQVAALMARASGLRRTVLVALLARIETNEGLAEHLGVSVRAVEKARQWMRREMTGARPAAAADGAQDASC